MSLRSARWVAWGIAALSALLAMAAVVMWLLNGYLTASSLYPPNLECALAGIVGAIILTYRPRNTIGWICCGLGLAEAVTVFAPQYLTYVNTHPPMPPLTGLVAWLNVWSWAPGFILLFVLLPSLFPTGTLISPRWRPVPWIALLTVLPWLLGSAVVILTRQVQAAQINAYQPSGAFGALLEADYLLMCVLAVLGGVSLVLRLRRSRGDERQQLKWFAYASVIAVIGVVADVVGSALSPDRINVATEVLVSIAVPLPFVAIVLALLRYRLYDIDIIINRTLVYGSLTAILAAVYFACVIGAQAITERLTGQTRPQPVVIVASTLLIAALFTPLRHRLQSAIDRRFYRRKYDAARTLETFSATLRSQVDLADLSTQLQGVVAETLQPEYVSLWLRSPYTRQPVHETHEE